MNTPIKKDVYLSFFMFTTDLRPDDPACTKLIIQHIRELTALGYTGFDLPIPPPADSAFEPARDIERYTNLKRALDRAGLDSVGFTTNVYAPRISDPSSPFKEQRESGLAYLKSRVDITAALGAEIMAGPLVHPYGVFPTSNFNEPIWSDALQDWMIQRYRDAQPVFDEVGEYAEERGVKIAIEPVDHWETAAPNLVTDVLSFLEGVSSRQIGVCIDSAHVVLGSDGVAVFEEAARRAGEQERLHYVQVSAPDRGAVHDSWIPWKTFLSAVMPRYQGPILVEIFNAIPAFLNGLRLTRRKFWIPGEDVPNPEYPDAYVVAARAIEAVRKELTEAAGLIRGTQEKADYHG